MRWLAALLLVPLAVPAREPAMRGGPVTDGLQATITLPKRTFRPGERITLELRIFNGSGQSHEVVPMKTRGYDRVDFDLPHHLWHEENPHGEITMEEDYALAPKNLFPTLGSIVGLIHPHRTRPKGLVLAPGETYTWTWTVPRELPSGSYRVGMKMHPTPDAWEEGGPMSLVSNEVSFSVRGYVVGLIREQLGIN